MWLRTHLLTPRSPMDLRLSTLIATIRTVTQQEVTQLRQQLRQTLRQHCTVHITTPPGFTCQSTREDCLCLQTAQQPPAIINLEQTPPPPPPTHDPDVRNCHSTPPTNDASSTRPDHDHSTPSPSPPAVTDAPSQAMLDQYGLDLQAIPALINAIEPQMLSNHSPNPKVAAHVNHHPPPPTLTAQGIHRPPEVPSDRQPSPQPPPTEAQDRKWRLCQYPLTTPSSSTSPRWHQILLMRPRDGLQRSHTQYRRLSTGGNASLTSHSPSQLLKWTISVSKTPEPGEQRPVLSLHLPWRA